MEQFLELAQNHWPKAVELVFIALSLWLFYRQFRSSTGMRVVFGLGLLLLAAGLLAHLFQLEWIGFFVRNLSFFVALVLIVVFQPELRRAVAEIGNKGFLFFSENRKEFIEHIEDAVRQLSAKRFGALIAIERGIDLKSHLETGVLIDARFSKELLLTIFHPRTALHDGGMVVRDNRVRAAGCVFPVSQREMTDRSIGLRHRAGLGLSEESDAIAIVVSEETGHISICHEGALERDLEMDEFRRRLAELLQIESGDEDLEGSDDTDEKATVEETKKAKPSVAATLAGAEARSE